MKISEFHRKTLFREFINFTKKNKLDHPHPHWDLGIHPTSDNDVYHEWTPPWDGKCRQDLTALALIIGLVREGEGTSTP